MAKLVPENHPALHQIAEEISDEEFENGYVKKLLTDLGKAIKAYNVEGYVAMAIAAPQIGVSKRVFIVSDQSEDKERLPSLIAINPKIVKTSKRTGVNGEGCLSVANHYGIVRRHKNVTLRAQDENGKEYERGAGGLLAQIFQHEVDHLDGLLFVDRAEKVWHKDELHKIKQREAKK